jgi:hypothetical protein
MSDEVRGRFGVVAPEAVAYLRAIADAYYRAPAGEWGEASLHHVLMTECSRYGIDDSQLIQLDPPPPAVVDAEDGE